VSDGDRFVALQRTPQTIEIRDDVKHLKRTLNLACAPVSISRGGTLLAECGPQSYVAVDLLSGARTPVNVPFDAASPTANLSRAVAAGREWVSEEHNGYHWGNRVYRNLRTGETRSADEAGTAIDLDAPQLTVPLCAPITRSAQQSLYEWGDLPDAKWAPFDSYDGHVAALNGVGAEPGAGLLWRCGDARPRRIARAVGLSAGAGWSTWLDRTVHADRPAWAQRVDKGAARVKLSRKAQSVVHTRVAVYTRQSSGRVYRGKLPAAK
jgi:hypothetical protein